MALFRPDDVPDLTGKVAIVTGSKGGIGFETVYLLARKGCTVYLAGRGGRASLDEAIKRLKTTHPDVASATLFPLELDLSSTAGSADSAAEFLRIHDGRLDIVIANAAISVDNAVAPSPEGFENHFQTNHLGHFAFVTALLPRVEATAAEHGDARIVIVASDAHTFVGGIDWTAIRQDVVPEMLGIIGGMKRYGQSKLANILFARELDRRLRERGIENIWVNSLHPGTIPSTGLGGNGAQLGYSKVVVKILSTIKAVAGLLMFSHQDGAMTQIYAATSPEIVKKSIHGEYLTPVLKWTGGYLCSRVGKSSEASKNEDEATKLWELSEKAVRDAAKAST